MKEMNNSNEQINNKKIWKGIFLHFRYTVFFWLSISFMFFAFLEIIISNIFLIFNLMSSKEILNTTLSQGLLFFLIGFNFLDIKIYEFNFLVLPIRAKDLLKVIMITAGTVLIIPFAIIALGFYFYQEITSFKGVLILLLSSCPIIFSIFLLQFSAGLSGKTKDLILKYCLMFLFIGILYAVYVFELVQNNSQVFFSTLVLFCASHSVSVLASSYLISIVISIFSYKLGVKQFSKAIYKQNKKGVRI